MYVCVYIYKNVMYMHAFTYMCVYFEDYTLAWFCM